ncbi:MAG: DUF5989 family protein [Mariniblastus sp.]
MNRNLKNKSQTQVEPHDDSFARESETKPPTIFGEFVDFLIHNKKWWLTPIIIVLLLLSVFAILTNTAIGPFIYVLF